MLLVIVANAHSFPDLLGGEAHVNELFDGGLISLTRRCTFILADCAM